MRLPAGRSVTQAARRTSYQAGYAMSACQTSRISPSRARLSSFPPFCFLFCSPTPALLVAWSGNNLLNCCSKNGQMVQSLPRRVGFRGGSEEAAQIQSEGFPQRPRSLQGSRKRRWLAQPCSNPAISLHTFIIDATRPTISIKRLFFSRYISSSYASETTPH
jgi:hypothetical protein